MPIQVICHGCHAKFKVSDKFAGKVGPCPKCKVQIQIPEADEEIVIHGGEEDFGPTGVSGQAVLKPIEREVTTYSTPVIAGLAAVSLFVPILAIVFRFLYPAEDGVGTVPSFVLGLGAAVLAPPLVWAGYAFFRNDELQAYEGSELWTRVSICAFVYAILWGVLWGIKTYLGDNGKPPEIYEIGVILAILVGGGTLASLATLDLDGLSAAMHYGMYLGITVVLRIIMNLPAI